MTSETAGATVELSGRDLAAMLLVPAGMLPLLLLVKAGPVEVAATTFPLFAYVTVQRCRRLRGPTAPRSAAVAVAQTCFVYALAMILGLVAYASADSPPETRNWLQRLVFGEAHGLGHSHELQIALRLAHLAAVHAFFLLSWLAGLLAWATARRGFGYACLSVPGAFGAIWWLLALGAQKANPAVWPKVSLSIVGTVTLCVWLAAGGSSRPARGAGDAPKKTRLQFSLRTLLAATAIIGLWSAVVVFAGNARKADHPEPCRVAGTVVCVGRAVEGALVVFIPLDADEPGPAFGVSDAAGRFTLSRSLGSKPIVGVLPGGYDVIVRAVPVAEAAQSPPDDTAALAALSDNRSVDFEATVVAGAANDFTFNLP